MSVRESRFQGRKADGHAARPMIPSLMHDDCGTRAAAANDGIVPGSTILRRAKEDRPREVHAGPGESARRPQSLAKAIQSKGRR